MRYLALRHKTPEAPRPAVDEYSYVFPSALSWMNSSSPTARRTGRTHVTGAWPAPKTSPGSARYLYNRLSNVMSLSAGTRLGPYEIIVVIGGGMGKVYRAAVPHNW
jgi:hypothetical protein